jgi:hypothetical protein
MKMIDARFGRSRGSRPSFRPHRHNLVFPTPRPRQRSVTSRVAGATPGLCLARGGCQELPVDQGLQRVAERILGVNCLCEPSLAQLDGAYHGISSKRDPLTRVGRMLPVLIGGNLFLDVGCGDDSARRARTLTASGSRQDFSRLSSRLSVEKISHNSAQLMKA